MLYSLLMQGRRVTRGASRVTGIEKRRWQQSIYQAESVSVQAASFADEVGNFGQKKFFLRRRKWDGGVGRGDPDDWAIEIVEGFFVDDGGNFSGQSASARVLVKDDYFVRLLHRRGNRLAIERRDCAQVEDFDFDSFFAQKLGCFERGVEHRRVSDHAEMMAFACDSRLADWNHVILIGNFIFNSSIEIFVLEKNHGILIADRGLDQSLGVVCGCWANDFQSGGVHKPHLRILRMKWAAMPVAAARAAQHQRSGRSPAIMRRTDHVGDLVEGAADEIHELEFGDWTHAGERGSESRANYGGFGDGSVDDALGAEAVDESVGDFEGAAVDADVFTEAEDGGVAVHFFPDSLADGFEVGEEHDFIRSLPEHLSLGRSRENRRDG